MIIGRVRQVRVLTRSVRETAREEVEKYVTAFSTTGYDWAAGLIKIVEDFTQQARDFPELTVCPNTGIPEDKSDRVYVTLDGHHRQTALVTLLDRGLPNASETTRYALVSRRDGAPMRESEVLTLGADSNDYTVQSKNMDTADVVVFLVNWVRATHNERLDRKAPGLRLGETKTADLLTLMLKTKMGGVCKEDGSLAFSVPTMRRMLNIGLLALEDPTSVKFMTEKLKQFKTKGSGDGSFSIDTLISLIMLCAETVGVDKEAVRLRLLQMAWEFTCHRTADNKVRRLVSGNDGTFYACALLMIKYVQDETIKVIRLKGGRVYAHGTRPGKGKQPAGSPSVEAGDGSSAEAVDEEEMGDVSKESRHASLAATIHASTGSLDLLEQNRPGVSMKLDEELTNIFVGHYDVTENAVTVTGASGGSKLLSAPLLPIMVANFHDWKKLVDDFIHPPPPPPPKVRTKKPAAKDGGKKDSTPKKPKKNAKDKNEGGSKGKNTTDTGSAAKGDAGDKAGAPPAGAGADGGQGDGKDKAGADGAGGTDAAETGGNAEDKDKDKDAEGGPPHGDKRKADGAAAGEERRSKRQRHAPKEHETFVHLGSDDDVEQPPAAVGSVRAKSPFARNVWRARAGGIARWDARHLLSSEGRPYEDAVPPIAPRLHDAAASTRRKLMEPFFGTPGEAASAVHPGHVRLPAYAAILPVEHQGRDLIAGKDWVGIGKDASRFMAARGLQLMQGMPGVPKEAAEDKLELQSLLSGVASVAYAKTLTESGWVVIEDAVADGMPKSATSDGTCVHAVLRHFSDQFMGEAEFGKAAATNKVLGFDPVWAPNHNVDIDDVDEASWMRGQGRFTVLPKAMATGAGAEKDAVYIEKLRVDLCLAAIANAVLASVSTRPVVQAPKTGARVLMTTEKAQRQRPHIDSALLPDKLEKVKHVAEAADKEASTPAADDDVQFVSATTYKMPVAHSFFIMASGEDPFTLAVWPGSVLALRHVADGHPIHRKLVREVIEVPKNSVLICRSDAVHAGTGADEDKPRLNKAPVELAYPRSIRFHMYLQHPKQPLIDAIYPVSSSMFASNASPRTKKDKDDKDTAEGGEEGTTEAAASRGDQGAEKDAAGAGGNVSGDEYDRSDFIMEPYDPVKLAEEEAAEEAEEDDGEAESGDADGEDREDE